MISLSTFDQKLYNQLKIITSIQKDLSKVNNSNIEQIGTSILNKKAIIESQAGVLILAQCFNDMADFFPKNIELFVDLFIFLLESKSSTNYLRLLKDYIVLCIHTREKLRSSELFFLRSLLIRKVITIESIINEINLMEPNYDKQKNSHDKLEDDNSNDQKTLTVDDENYYISKMDSNNNVNLYLIQKKFKVINWFYPEIKEVNERLIQNAVGEIDYEIPEEFKNKDLDSIKQIMNAGYSMDTLAKIIRDDDIESFLRIVEELGTKFDVNQIIKSTKYERCSLLSYDPNLIQYSAFFNSIKIFKYLFLNKADLHIKNNSIHPLIHFAIGGGSIEIIHILEQKDIDFCTGISFSIRYFQNDIFSWILENHPPSSDDDFSRINYYFDCDLSNKFLYAYSKKMCCIDDGDLLENDFYHQQFIHYLQSDYGYRNYSDDDDYNDDDDDDDDNNEEEDSSNDFAYFDFDFIFQTIMETNNYLALFLLFDHGMDINARNKKSRKTLLHFAIQKGKSFLTKLLLSNKLIDFTLKDKYEETPIVYSVKYARKKIFYYMIKEKNILDSLTNYDYIKMIYYASYCGLKDIINYISSIWKVDLMLMMEADDIKEFCTALNYLPLYFFIDQIVTFLTESFKARKYDYFCIFANRVLKEKSLNLKSSFYFVPPKMKKDINKEFRKLCSLLAYYNRSFYKENNYYRLYKKNLNSEDGLKTNYKYYSTDYKDDEYYSMKKENNTIYIFNLNDLKATLHCQVSINPKNDDDDDSHMKKKKKSNNKPMINVDDWEY